MARAGSPGASVTIPAGLASSCAGDPHATAWLKRVPAAVVELCQRWSLSVHPPFNPVQETRAWVAPVTRADGTAAVLKLGLPHMEATHEIAGLSFWNGHNTVALLDADEALNAMLLEACVPGTPLSSAPAAEQDVVIGQLLGTLSRKPPPGPPFRPLSEMLQFWGDHTRRDADRWPEPALVQQGLNLFSELPRSASRNVLLFTDLHAGNVLRAQRARWLAIDPKPFVGDPAYDATQHVFNNTERMLADPDRTLADIAAHAGLSTERLRLWTFARAVAQPRERWRGDPWLDIGQRIAP